MPEKISPETRSRMMSGIRGKNTRPEITVRSFLHRNGFRFRLHGRDLPGKPDVVLPRWKVAVFVHGCFWHGHIGCRYFKLPKTRAEFWKTKIDGNKQRDAVAVDRLREADYGLLQQSDNRATAEPHCQLVAFLRQADPRRCSCPERSGASRPREPSSCESVSGHSG
ncbi:MAG: DNA mismatch endonuclease Vsr [Verrucomicrobiaceae bacterium]|nr:MAG: DNA mismatch endonuclease Vsr [Verrucomicrobiaceae bacterium]